MLFNCCWLTRYTTNKNLKKCSGAFTRQLSDQTALPIKPQTAKLKPVSGAPPPNTILNLFTHTPLCRLPLIKSQSGGEGREVLSKGVIKNSDCCQKSSDDPVSCGCVPQLGGSQCGLHIILLLLPMVIVNMRKIECGVGELMENTGLSEPGQDFFFFFFLRHGQSRVAEFCGTTLHCCVYKWLMAK